MELWEQRAARNEALFREVNERVALLAPEAEVEVGFVCECSDEACIERLRVARAAYEAVRAHPRRFLVVPGHETAVERVVEHHAGYLVVEKHGSAGEIAERHHPRP